MAPLAFLPPEFKTLVTAAVALGAGGCAFAAARRAETALWVMFGTVLVLYGIAIVFHYYGVDGPANNLFGISYVLSAAGLLSIMKRGNPGRFGTALLDGLIAGSGGAMLAWIILIEPFVRSVGVSGGEIVVAVLYPVINLAMLTSLCGVLLAPGRKPAAARLLVAAVAVEVAVDFASVALLTSGPGSWEVILAILRVGSYVLMGAAALYPRARLVGPPQVQALSRPRLAVFGFAASGTTIGLAVAALGGGRVSVTAFVVSLAGLLILVLLRMVGLLRNFEGKVAELHVKSRALVDSEERYRSVVDGVDEVIFKTDSEGNWTFLNPAWTRITGLPIESSLGRDFLEQVHPDDRTSAIEQLGPLMEGEEAETRAELRLLGVGGEARTCEFFASLTYDDVERPTGMAGTIIDITERKVAESALLEAEERYRLLVEQMPAVTYIDSLDGYKAANYTSPRIKELLGYTAAEWQRDPDAWKNCLHPEDRARVIAERDKAGELQEPFHSTYRVYHRDGHVVWVRDEAVLHHDETGVPAFWQGVVLDVTERQMLEDQLTHQAFHDPLTGLANRALFTDRVEHALALKSRLDSSLAVLFLDLDNFKNVNDSLGHDAGDELLKKVAARLLESLRPSDTAARLGGDEFAVLLEDADLVAAQGVAARLLAAIEQPLKIHESEILISGSIGIAQGSQSSDGNALLRNADTAMYAAKEAGRGRFEVFEERMHSGAVRRLELQTELKRALEKDEFFLNYQPVLDLATSEVLGLEALLRWNHPVRGLVSPADFIPLAEETGLIVPIGQLVLEKVCRQFSYWMEIGVRPDLRVGVNFSARQLQLPSLVDDVADTLLRYGVPPDNLIMEITESVFMSDPEEIAGRLHTLKELGVPLALDDFGTGFSSLSYLRRFPVRILKVDKFFVKGVDKGPDESAYAQAIMGLGQSLALDVVAEGIETTSELEALKQMGCGFGQGFLFYKPMSPDDLELLLASGPNFQERILEPGVAG